MLLVTSLPGLGIYIIDDSALYHWGILNPVAGSAGLDSLLMTPPFDLHSQTGIGHCHS